MSSKHIFAAIFAIVFIVGWNVFLIQRDQKMFDAYEKAVKYDHPTLQEKLNK